MLLCLMGLMFASLLEAGDIDVGNAANRAFRDVDLGLGMGLQKTSVQYEGAGTNIRARSFERYSASPLLELGFPLSSHVTIGINPNQNIRYYKLSEASGYNREFIFSGKYIDFPLNMRTKFYGVELGGGPNLGVLWEASYRGAHTLANNEDNQDARKLVPGYHFYACISPRDSRRIGMVFAFTQDLTTFSNTYQYGKTQQRLTASLIYRFTHGPGPNELIDPEFFTLPETISVATGWKHVGFRQSETITPYIAFIKSRQYANGFGIGSKNTITPIYIHEIDAKAAVLRAVRHMEFYWSHRFAEAYFSPGLGVEAGTYHVPDQKVSNKPYFNPMLDSEAGILLHIGGNAALDVFCNQVNSLFYNSRLKYGLGVRMSL